MCNGLIKDAVYYPVCKLKRFILYFEQLHVICKDKYTVLI